MLGEGEESQETHLEGLLASLSTLLCESGAKWDAVPFSCFTREAAFVEKCYVDSSRYNDLSSLRQRFRLPENRQEGCAKMRTLSSNVANQERVMQCRLHGTASYHCRVHQRLEERGTQGN